MALLISCGNWVQKMADKLEITLWKKAEQIKQGDKFIALIDNVEGHRRVILTRLTK